MMTDVLQNQIPYAIDPPRPLPGIQPLRMSDWLHQDEAFSGQMAERNRLLSCNRENVLQLDETAVAAAQELLDLVLEHSYPGAGEAVLRPDRIRIDIDRSDPLATLARLVQEDFCILQKRGQEHVLTGAILCFPASWSLSEKFLRPLGAIHDPVDSYDAKMALRVQRLFDGVRVGRPLWRFNALWYATPDLYQPRGHNDRRDVPQQQEAAYLRSERQSILRLPETQAVVFSIHTYVVARHRLGVSSAEDT